MADQMLAENISYVMLILLAGFIGLIVLFALVQNTLGLAREARAARQASEKLTEEMRNAVRRLEGQKEAQGMDRGNRRPIKRSRPKKSPRPRR